MSLSQKPPNQGACFGMKYHSTPLLQRFSPNAAESHTGNQYGVVFIVYLTKWPKVFATSDQTALMIAKLFVEQIVC